MKESHRKGVANHPGPESCVGSRKAAGEALTGAHAGWVWSCEIIATGVPTSFRMAEGNTDGCAIASIRRTPHYVERQLGLDLKPDQVPPERQQIVLLNRAEVEKVRKELRPADGKASDRFVRAE